VAGKRYPFRPLVLAAGAAALGLVSIASAQDSAGGKILRVTVGQSLQYSDNIDLVANPDDGVFRSSTRVGLSYSDITRTQSLRFTTGGSYDIDNDGDSDLSDPFVRLSYALEGANSRLSFSGNYIRSNLDDAFSTAPLVDSDGDIVSETGRIENGVRINTDYRLGFETGLRSSIGFRLDMSAQDRRYTETTDADLFETETRKIDVLTLFRIDPAITARLTASSRRYTAEDDDQTNRTDTSFGVGVAFDLTPVSSLDLSFGQQRIETERLTGTTLAEGQTYGVGFTLTRPNGAIETNFSSSPSVNGRRNTLRTNRSMDLRRDGTLSYGVGITKTEGFSSEPLFSLAYAQPTQRGRFGIQLTQEARTDEEDDEAVILTQLSANYALALTETLNWSVSAGFNDVAARADTGEDRRRINLRSNLTGQINDISSWSFGANLSDTSTSSLAVSDSERRYGIQLSYRRDLAQDWDVVARYQHTTILDTDAADRRSNAISLGLEKTFDFRP
jgi:hypothetical protein